MSSEDHELWLIGYLLFLSELEINILISKGFPEDLDKLSGKGKNLHRIVTFSDKGSNLHTPSKAIDDNKYPWYKFKCSEC